MIVFALGACYLIGWAMFVYVFTKTVFCSNAMTDRAGAIHASLASIMIIAPCLIYAWMLKTY